MHILHLKNPTANELLKLAPAFMEPLVHFFCTARPPSQNALQQLSVPPVPLYSEDVHGVPATSWSFLTVTLNSGQRRSGLHTGCLLCRGLRWPSTCPSTPRSVLSLGAQVWQTDVVMEGGGGYGLFLLIHNHSGDIFNSCWGQIWMNRVNIAVDESTYDNRRRWLFLGDSSSSSSFIRLTD